MMGEKMGEKMGWGWRPGTLIFGGKRRGPTFAHTEPHFENQHLARPISFLMGAPYLLAMNISP
jgi:hypothetical protein